MFDPNYLQKIRQHPFRIALLMAVVLFFTLLSGRGLVLPSLQDSSHALVFGLATELLLLILIPSYSISNRQRTKYVLLICIAAFAFGIFVELVQPLFGRDRSLLDASYDLAGCTAAGLFYLRKYTEQAQTKSVLLFFACLQVLSCLMIPASSMLIVAQRYFSAPLLVSFDAPWERHIRSINDGTHFSIVPAPQNWQHDSLVGRFELGQASYPGISFPYIYGDWSNYSTLSFKVYSEHKHTITLHLRAHDVKHNNEYRDRFNQSFSIKLGLNLIEVDLEKVKHSPKSRELDLGKMASLALFMTRHKELTTLYIDDIQLTN